LTGSHISCEIGGPEHDFRKKKNGGRRMKKLTVIVLALFMASVTVMAQDTVKPAEAPKKEAVESRFKDMTLLQLLEEVRKGRDADIQKYLSEN
jgi:hypothetical protein